MSKRALITGITGQDGSYLAELLLAKGYEVHGIIRRSSVFNTARIDHLLLDPHTPGARLFLHYGDVTDGTRLRRVVAEVDPDEVYNLAAQSNVRISFDQPEYTADVVGTGTLRMLEAVRDHCDSTSRSVRFYQAGSSEMFGNAPSPQSEGTEFDPRSPYAVAKLAAHRFCWNYREAYGMHICNGILFNHESPRRGERFLTRKVTRAVGRIKLGLQERLYLGNLAAERDWGYAGDYVEAMWLMVQQDKPDDYVIATGVTHSVQKFVESAFAQADLDWKEYVEIDPRYMRPTEVDLLAGDAGKAERELGWTPKCQLPELVAMMVEHDLDLARQELVLKEAGHRPTRSGGERA